MVIPSRVHNIEDAYAYILDCQLATVCYMASIKRKTKHEFERQISIAQQMLNWSIDFKVDISDTRGQKVLDKFYGSVNTYARSFEHN